MQGFMHFYCEKLGLLVARNRHRGRWRWKTHGGENLAGVQLPQLPVNSHSDRSKTIFGGHAAGRYNVAMFGNVPALTFTQLSRKTGRSIY